MRAQRSFPLVLVLTVAFVGATGVAGPLLLTALDAVATQQLRAGLEDQAQRLTDYLEGSLTPILWNLADDQLTLASELLARDPRILSLRIRDSDGKVLREESRPGLALVSFERRLSYRSQALGDLRLTFAEGPLQAQRQTLLGQSLLVYLGFVVFLAVLTPVLLTLTVLRPFSRLTRPLLVDRSDGPFPDLPAPSSRIAEVRTLEEALHGLNGSVLRQMLTLEQKVNDRTRDLNEARSQLVRAETLASVGHLAAGLAHELNTPLAAIESSVRFLVEDLNRHLLPHLAAGSNGQLTAEQLRDMTALAAQLDRYADRRARSELRRRWLEAGKDEESHLLELITNAGLDPWFEALLRLPEPSTSSEAVGLAARWSRSLNLILLAAGRGAGIVASLHPDLSTSREVTPLDVGAELAQAWALVQGRWGSLVRMTLSAPPGLIVLADRAALGKLWQNLLTNAAEAVGSAGGEVEVAADRDGGRVRVLVTDHGPGMSGDVMSRAFEPYFTTKSGRLGLGLTLSRQVVEQLGGEIRLDSDGGGTRVEVWLPLAAGLS